MAKVLLFCLALLSSFLSAFSHFSDYILLLKFFYRQKAARRHAWGLILGRPYRVLLGYMTTFIWLIKFIIQSPISQHYWSLTIQQATYWTGRLGYKIMKLSPEVHSVVPWSPNFCVADSLGSFLKCRLSDFTQRLRLSNSKILRWEWGKGRPSCCSQQNGNL